MRSQVDSVQVRQRPCANGETVEWSLWVGDFCLETIFSSALTKSEVTRKLLAKAVDQGR